MSDLMMALFVAKSLLLVCSIIFSVCVYVENRQLRLALDEIHDFEKRLAKSFQNQVDERMFKIIKEGK